MIFINECNEKFFVNLRGKFNTNKENAFCEYNVTVYDRVGESTERLFKDGEFEKAVKYAYVEIERLKQKYSEVK